MKKVFDLNADVQFGKTDQLPDWREEEDDDDPDDEETETPEDVVAILGFDPVDVF